MSWKTLFGKPAASNGADPEVPSAHELLLETRALIQSHQTQLNALRLESGYEMSEFRQRFEAPVLEVAQWVHTLPASSIEYHCESGGLLRLCVESAAAAYRRSDGKLLAQTTEGVRDPPERERHLRYLAFLGGLFCGLGRCAAQVEVSVAKAGVWNALAEGLWSWRRRANAAELTLRWREIDVDATHRASVWIASRVISPELIKHLERADGALMSVLVSIIGGERRSALGMIVEEAQRAVIELDQSKRVKRTEITTPIAIAFEHRLLDALRELCRQKWQVNTSGAIVWCTDQGVFLDWIAAATDVSIRLKAAKVTWARSTDTIAEVLLAERVLIVNPEATSHARHLYRIQVQGRGGPKRWIDAVKVAQPERIGLHLEGVDRIAAQIQTQQTISVDVPTPVANSPVVQLELVSAAEPPTPRTPPPELPPRAASGPSVRSAPTSNVTGELLPRFGTAGTALQRLAELMSAQQPELKVVRMEEGLALAYPDTVTLLCSQPEEFVRACEAQGLLVPERAGGRKVLRTAPADRADLPRQYIVLAPRVLRYLGLERQAS